MTAAALKWVRPAQPSAELLRTATLWKAGLLDHLNSEVSRMRSAIEHAESVDVAPAQSLKHDYRLALMRQKLLKGLPTSTKLVEMFQHELQASEDATLGFVEKGIQVEEESLQSVRRLLASVAAGAQHL